VEYCVVQAPSFEKTPQGSSLGLGLLSRFAIASDNFSLPSSQDCWEDRWLCGVTRGGSRSKMPPGRRKPDAVRCQPLECNRTRRVNAGDEGLAQEAGSTVIVARAAEAREEWRLPRRLPRAGHRSGTASTRPRWSPAYAISRVRREKASSSVRRRMMWSKSTGSPTPRWAQPYSQSPPDTFHGFSATQRPQPPDILRGS
jgi:hypothetical protein